jgi:CDP-diacylglycerol--glycerol-3-phosphate 3-phosphatidyltransferase
VRLTLPTQLTLARVLAIPLLVVIYYSDFPHDTIVAALIFIVAAITDWLDGYLARKLNAVSNFGAFLDPVADKLIVATALVVLLQNDPTLSMLVPVAIIIGREITISALREWMAELGQRASVAVRGIGKLKTGTQMTAIAMLLWQESTFGLPVYSLGYVLLLVSSVLTVWSMFIYLRAAWPLLSKAD